MLLSIIGLIVLGALVGLGALFLKDNITFGESKEKEKTDE